MNRPFLERCKCHLKIKNNIFIISLSDLNNTKTPFYLLLFFSQRHMARSQIELSHLDWFVWFREKRFPKFGKFSARFKSDF